MRLSFAPLLKTCHNRAISVAQRTGMIEKTFSQQGALGQAIPGFQPRQAQVDMAKAVASAIANQSQLVVEAGTGTKQNLRVFSACAAQWQKGDHQYRF